MMTTGTAIILLALIFGVFIIALIAICSIPDYDNYTCDWCGRNKKAFRFYFSTPHVCKTCARELKVKTVYDYKRYKVARDKAIESLEL
jgi:hypothetical protein